MAVIMLLRYNYYNIFKIGLFWEAGVFDYRTLRPPTVNQVVNVPYMWQQSDTLVMFLTILLHSQMVD